MIGGSIGWVEELDDDLYLGSGENLRVLFVALGYHGGPHVAGVMHLATEEALRPDCACDAGPRPYGYLPGADVAPGIF